MLKIFLRSFSQLQEYVPSSYIPSRIRQLAFLKDFTLEECKKEIEYNTKTSSLEFVSGIRVTPEQLTMLLKVADCLKDDELKKPSLSIPIRKEICSVLNCSEWEVTKFVILYKSHLRMYQYLVARVKRNEVLPTNPLEIKLMMKNDPMPKTKESMFMKFKKKKYSKFQKKYDYTKRLNY
jgi:hypothetical protein